jgi:hypothetical protein
MRMAAQQCWATCRVVVFEAVPLKHQTVGPLPFITASIVAHAFVVSAVLKQLPGQPLP